MISSRPMSGEYSQQDSSVHDNSQSRLCCIILVNICQIKDFQYDTGTLTSWSVSSTLRKIPHLNIASAAKFPGKCPLTQLSSSWECLTNLLRDARHSLSSVLIVALLSVRMLIYVSNIIDKD